MKTNRYEIKLSSESFNSVKSGVTTVDLGLNDKERQPITIDDLIIFINAGNETERIYARVTGFYVYQSFEELFGKVDKSKLGYKADEKPDPGPLRKLFSAANEKKYGVKGIKFEYLPNFKETKDMTEAEAREFMRGLISEIKGMRKKLCRNIERNDYYTEYLVDFIKSDPDLVFCAMDESEYDMLKWLLSESIKNTQTLLAQIQEWEDKTIKEEKGLYLVK